MAGHQRQVIPAASKDNGLALRHRCDHRDQQHPLALVAERAVLTPQADHLSLELGAGGPGRLIGSANLKLPLRPARPNDARLILWQDFLNCCPSAS